MTNTQGNGPRMYSAGLRSKYVNDSVETMSPGRQIVALYDRLLLDHDRAIAAIERNDLEATHGALVHAQEIVNELYYSLDTTQWPAARGLADLYVFVREELVAANVEKNATRVVGTRELLAPLRDAWSEAAGIVPSKAGDRV